MPEYFSSQPGEPGTSHLSSNNPFRNRAVSPSFPQSPTSPFEDPTSTTSSARPVSRNPFLDPANGPPAAPKSNSALLIDLDDMPSQADDGNSKTFMADIFSSLNIDNKTTKSGSPAPNSAQPRRPMDDRGPPPAGRGRPAVGPPPRAKNIPPRRSPSPNHRPARSQEDASKRHHPSSSAASGRTAQQGPAPDRSAGRRPSVSNRPRRNSESSVVDDINPSKSDKILREARRREQANREKSSSRPNRRNDIIDQLDATSIFGNVFHHDGPFDALNPHRNRHSRRAPMQAFPKDSLNNVLGGSGPLNTRPDHKTFMGQGEDEAFRDFAASREKVSSSANATVFDPRRASIVHGDETLGLGTSTFLEGTPVARTTIQRREAEKAQDTQENSLQRKKSLAQRFRSTKRGPREGNAGRAFSTDGTPIESRSRGYGSERPSRQFEEYDPSRGEEDMISVRRKVPPMPGSPPSPRDDFERRQTSDAIPMSDAPKHSHSATFSGSGEDVPKASSGLLARVKSLKGGRRAPPPPPSKDS